MSEDATRQRLGRGLAALIGEMDKPASMPVSTVSSEASVPIEFLSANPRNPRRKFAETDLTDLAQSIRQHGIVQPIIVRPSGSEGRYEIVAGERRWRAAQRAELTTVPVIIRDLTDRTALEIAIIENVQRSDLNPVEEAAGYQQLIADHGYTQADLGNVVGKSRSHVANTLRLLKLPEVIRDLINDGSISAGHARTLVTASDPVGLAKRIVEDGLSVRQTEALAQQPEETAKPSKTDADSQPRDANIEALETLLSNSLGLVVRVNAKARGGQVRINYKTLDQLDDLSRRLRS